jgi:hypothetical protein
MEIQQVTSNLQEQQKDSRNIIIILLSYFCVLIQGLNSSGVGYWVKGTGLYLSRMATYLTPLMATYYAPTHSLTYEG